MVRTSHRSFVAASMLAATALFAVSAHAAFGNASNAAVSFLASGPGGLKIEGKTNALTVSEAEGKVRFVVPLAGLNTGISLRDSHMRDKYLEVGKFPNAELTIDRSAIKLPADGQSSTGQAAGTLTIHGQSKPVNVGYQAKRSGNTFDISGALRINIKDYDVNVPSYLGVTVKPEVDVTLSARVQDL